MKKIATIAGLFSLCSTAFGQMGVNNQTPQATMDITAKTTDGSKPEGMIAPRLSGDQIKSGDAQYTTAQRGTLLYATSAVTVASVKTANITAEGYYYFDGNVWQKVGAGGGGSDTDDWKRLGNAGTTAGTNFIGTTDNQDFVTKTNNTEAMRVTNSQKVLVGTATVPTGGTSAKVIIDNGTTNGAVQITDGTEGTGKVLLSDANGVGRWQELAGSWSAYTYGGGKNADPDSTAPSLLDLDLGNSNISTVSGTIINGTGGNIDLTSNKIYLPYTGIYRVIVYMDFIDGTIGNSIDCNDIQLAVFDAGSSFIYYNCDVIGPKDATRKNGYMQAVFNATPDSYIEVRSVNKVQEAVISVEFIK
ncbi:hypothetical protein [Chryseobacterium sp. KCF3-3]|uniref:hypothetical protein n=1 Tax=Chryseobacterium sp. KCF3-3 TaxID=3231511 RepID=UPI0038B32F06